MNSPGPSPRSAGDYLENVRAKMRQLEQATYRLSLAWDRELKRKYGYEWLNHVRPADSAEEVELARADWSAVRREFATMVAADDGFERGGSQ